MNWIEKLKHRWNFSSAWQVLVVLIVFACTGFTVLFIKPYVLAFFGGAHEKTTQVTILYYLFIFPIYNILLLGYGFVFGQFRFFWNFEKRMFRKIFSLFN